MKFSERQSSFLYGGLLLFILLSSGLLLSTNNTLQRLDLVLYDALLPLQSHSMSDQVVVIAIDDTSVMALGRWPWSRRRHAEMVDRLTTMGARAVGIDLLFSEEQRDDPEADALFAQSMERNARTVLVVAPAQQTPLDPIDELLPIPELALAAKMIGHVDVELDMDGLCRSFFLYGGIGDAHWPAFALAMLQIDDQTSVIAELKTATTSLKKDRDGWVRRHKILIPYANRGGHPKLLSYVDVLEGRVPESSVRDKYVLVGATATGLGDAISTPASRSHERMPGVELNAHILSGLLQNNAIYEVSRQDRLVLTAVLIVLGVFAVFMVSLHRVFMAILVSIVMIFAVSVTLLIFWQFWFPPVVALTMVLISWPLWSAWQLGIEYRLRQNLLQRLEKQTLHHMATGLPNHHMLEERLRLLNQSGSSSSTNRVAALMVLHINWPGSASIILGRPMDAPLLKAIGNRLREVVNGENFIAHLNGDDFAVLLTELANTLEVHESAETLLFRLQQPLEYGDHKLLLAPKIGVSKWPDDGVDAMTLLRNAYTAMFKSRIDDTDHLCVYSADIGKQLKVRYELEQALVHALERGEFQVHYQPQIHAKSGRIVGVEALLRWQNPILGWIGPDVFIPVAEHVGLINAIGDWVLKTACWQLHTWQQAGLGPLRLAVNVSPLQFLSPGIHTRIGSIIEHAGIQSDELELEITESSLMHDLDSAIQVLRQIKQAGMELAIDDFGTGYSSLSNLRHFPIDRLKIDQSFTREIGTNADATEITLTILAMGKRLGLGVIAEGVETAEQAAFLRQHGCDEFQGFLFSRALPANDLTTLLHNGVDQSDF